MSDGHESTRLGGIDEEILELVDINAKTFNSIRL